MEGKVIEEFEGIDTNIPEGRAMNCECAMTREYLSSGSQKPECCKNGNYAGMQCVAGLCFCVDAYGRQVGLEVEQADANEKLQCEDYCCESNDIYEDTDFCYPYMDYINLWNTKILRFIANFHIKV